MNKPYSGECVCVFMCHGVHMEAGRQLVRVTSSCTMWVPGTKLGLPGLAYKQVPFPTTPSY